MRVMRSGSRCRRPRRSCLWGLGVGIVIALFQALTQIQEMTLVFVPKIVAIFVALLIFLPTMGALMGGLAARIFERISVM